MTNEDADFEDFKSFDNSNTPKVALEYLGIQYFDWLAKINLLSVDESERQLRGAEDVNYKLEKLEEGLEFYLTNADTVQEKLIELNVAASTRLTLAEGVLMALDKNPDIKTVEQAETEIYDTIEILYHHKLPKDFIEKLAKEAIPYIEETLQNPSRKNSRNLRNLIEDWVLDAPIKEPKFSPKQINLFKQSRENQTNAVNDYQSSLLNALQEPNLDATMQTIVKTRLGSLEKFRGGFHKFLPAQHEKLSSMKIDDISKNYRNFKNKFHPGIQQTYSMASQMKQMLDLAPNDYYAREIPGVKLKENGIKSWTRAIDKLFAEKAAIWNDMHDLSRINPVFSNAESKYFFERALNKLSKDSGWNIEKNNGPRMVDSGTVNWNIRLRRNEAPGKKLYAEVKLDSLSTSLSESPAHTIYECSRILKKAINEEVGQVETINKRRRISADIRQNMDSLLKSQKHLTREVIEQLNDIQHEAKEFENTPSASLELLEKLLNVESTIRFQYAKNHSSPSMAALFFDQFEKLVEKKNQQITESKNPVMAEYNQKQLDSLRNHYNEFGPLITTDEIEGQFTQEDLDLVRELEQERQNRITLDSPKKGNQR